MSVLVTMAGAGSDGHDRGGGEKSSLHLDCDFEVVRKEKNAR